MTDTNVIKLAQPGTFTDSLTEILRSGARALLTQAVETEVAEFLSRYVPEPTDSRVRLVDIPSETAAVLRFTGSTDDAAVSARTTELLKLLRGTNWKIEGMPTAFFYNPPWTIPFLRRNEIAVTVSNTGSTSE